MGKKKEKKKKSTILIKFDTCFKLDRRLCQCIDGIRRQVLVEKPLSPLQGRLLIYERASTGSLLTLYIKTYLQVKQ